MENGISLYPGLDNTLEENLQLLDAAAKYGIRRVFTSLHIPETNVAVLKKELAKAKAMGYSFNVGPECEFFLFDFKKLIAFFAFFVQVFFDHF